MIQWSMQSETETILWQQQKACYEKLKEKNHQWETYQKIIQRDMILVETREST